MTPEEKIRQATPTEVAELLKHLAQFLQAKFPEQAEIRAVIDAAALHLVGVEWLMLIADAAADFAGYFHRVNREGYDTACSEEFTRLHGALSQAIRQCPPQLLSKCH